MLTQLLSNPGKNSNYFIKIENLNKVYLFNKLFWAVFNLFKYLYAIFGYNLTNHHDLLFTL